MRFTRIQSIAVAIGAHWRAVWTTALDMVQNEWPECIDHINGNPSDNRMINLRAATRQMNQRNQRTHKSNTSGRTGVSWNRFTQKWVATIKMDGISHYLGSYNNFDDAVEVRRLAEIQHGFTGRT